MILLSNKNAGNQQFQFDPSASMLRGYSSFSMPKPYASLNMPKKFPEDIECIIQSRNLSSGSLYISNIEAAENINTLKKFQIGAVLTCAKGYELKHPPSVIPHYKYIPTVDHDSCDISVHFDDAVDFIKDKLAKTNILVHCIAGVSRSVSMVLAYFIREQGMTYEEAYRTVKARRKIIHPNDGFIKQLKEYHKKKYASRNDKSASTIQDHSAKKVSEQTTPIKSNNYLEKNFLAEYPSTQLTPSHNGIKQKLEKYQSIQVNSKKYNYSESTAGPSIQTKQRQSFNRTATGYYPRYQKDSSRRVQLIKRYYDNDQTRNTRHGTYTPVSQKVIPIDLTPEKQEPKSVTPTKISSRDTFNEEANSPANNRKGYFEDMNKELSQKIDLIRKKYDQERTKLFEKYQMTDKKIPQDDNRLRNRDSETYTSTYRKNGSLPSQKALKKEPNEELLNGQRSFTRNYDDVKEMFSKSRKSYAQIYDSYMKGDRSKQPARKEEGYYLKYNYDIEKKIDATLSRYRPYGRYDDLRNRGYNNYLNGPYGYLYKV